jgi:hypothetical protein
MDLIQLLILLLRFSWVFWICRGLWYSLISYRYYCFVSFKIGSVEFRIISVWRFPLHICSYRDQSALSNLYRVGLLPTVECKLSRIMGKWSLPLECKLSRIMGLIQLLILLLLIHLFF